MPTPLSLRNIRAVRVRLLQPWTVMRHAAVALMLASPVILADTNSTASVQVIVSGDGTIQLSQWGTQKPRTPARLEFGMPRIPPVGRELTGSRSNVVQLTWEHEGIRYIQSVLLTPGPASPPGGVDVLMVQLTGENTATVYTNATASFSGTLDNRRLELELREDLIWDAKESTGAPLAQVTVPATGIASNQGLTLRFHGHMPPGTSGSMTFRIPLLPVADESRLNAIRDLDFTEEMRRIQRPFPTNAGTLGAPALRLQLSAEHP